ncbi:DUF3592 domain-containing protein [Pollutibacter soli]|uniref:DUF3592 domain-containing protein n=1 Tax=Pollutibacter soli TaxID=3034157 RepID=UPI00301340E7
MSGINVLLLVLAISGFLPLGIILYKRYMVKRILNTGTETVARVYKVVKTNKSSIEIVYYTYVDSRTGKQYSGHLTGKHGLYKNGETLQVFFLPENPSRSTVKGAWASVVFLIFGIVLALFVLFAVYKIGKGL